MNATLWQDLGLVLLRVPVGLLLIGHGTQKLFGWFGGHGIAGAGGYFESLGFSKGKVMATLAGLTEVAAGFGIAFGFLVPFAAAGLIGIMVNAIATVHGKSGPWVQNNGYEYPLVLTAIAVALALNGPGGISIDALYNFDQHAWFWGVGAILLGLLSAGAILGGRRRETGSTESVKNAENAAGGETPQSA